MNACEDESKKLDAVVKFHPSKTRRRLPPTPAMTKNSPLSGNNPHCDVTRESQTNEFSANEANFQINQMKYTKHFISVPTSSNAITKETINFQATNSKTESNQSNGVNLKMDNLDINPDEKDTPVVCSLCGIRIKSFAVRAYRGVLTSSHSVGRQIRRRKNSKRFVVNKPCCSQSGIYLGSVTTILTKGDGCTDIAVSKILKHSNGGKIGVPVTMTVKDQTVQLRCTQMVIENGGQCDNSMIWDMQPRRITTCQIATSSSTLLVWIYRHEAMLKRVVLRCHVVKMLTLDKAKTMVAEVNKVRQMFNSATGCPKGRNNTFHAASPKSKYTKLNFASRQLSAIPETIELA